MNIQLLFASQIEAGDVVGFTFLSVPWLCLLQRYFSLQNAKTYPKNGDSL